MVLTTVTSGSLSISQINSEMFPDITPVNSYNWYTKMTSNTFSGSFTPGITGSDPIKNIQLITNSGSNQVIQLYHKQSVQDFNQFIMTFSLWNNGLNSDGFCLYFGANSPVSSISPNNGSVGFNFQAIAGGTFPQGINFINSNGVSTISDTTEILNWTNTNFTSSNYAYFMIVYNKTSNSTWSIYYQGRLLFTYSDPNHPGWLTNSGNFWGFTSSAVNNVISFPPNNMTSSTLTVSGNSNTNLNGTYTASASTNFGGAEAFRAFQTTYRSSGDTNSWVTSGTTYPNGVYNGTGSFTTTVSSIAYAGEWIQLQVPNAINLISFVIQPQTSNFFSRTPTQFVVAGSTNGTTWTAIHIQPGFNWTNLNTVSFTCNQNNTNTYTYFRFIVRRINDIAEGYASIGIWQLYTNTGVTVSNSSLYIREINITADQPFNLVNSNNWYNNMTPSNTNTFTPIYSFSDPDRQIQLTNASSINGAGVFQNFRIQDYAAFTLTFQVYTTALSNVNNIFEFSMGGTNTYDINNNNTRNNRYGVLCYHNNSTTNILIYNNTGTLLATSSAFSFAINTWHTVTINYTRSQYYTWRITVNNAEVLTVIDTNQQYFLEFSGNNWGISSYSNNSCLNYIRHVNMVIKPQTGSNAKKLVTWLDWYNVFSRTKAGSSAFTGLLDSSIDNNYNYQLNNNTSNNNNWLFHNSPIQNNTSFVCSFDVYISIAVADYVAFFCGSTTSTPNNNPGSGNQTASGGYLVVLQVYTGGTLAQGIHLVNSSGTSVASTTNANLIPSTFVNNNCWHNITITYNKGITNTWIVTFNGQTVIAYSDSNNTTWLSSAGNFWGIMGCCGGSAMNAFIRHVSLSYVPSSTTNFSSLLAIAPGITNTTSGGLSTSSFYGQQATSLSNTTVTALDQGQYNRGPWGSTCSPDTLARWVWSNDNAPGFGYGSIVHRFSLSYYNTTNSPISANLYCVVDNYAKIYHNNILIKGPNGIWGLVSIIPSAMTSDNTAITNYGTYTASASTTSESLGYTAFDGSTTHWGTGGNGHPDGYNINSGVYLGTTPPTIVNGVSCVGAWLQIQTPNFFTLTYFTILGRQDQTLYLGRTPNKFVIAGSNNGTTWDFIHISSGGNVYSTSPTEFFCNQNNINRYRYFRIITQELVNGVTGAGQVSNIISIAEWVLYTNNVEVIPIIIQPNLNVFDFCGFDQVGGACSIIYTCFNNSIQRPIDTIIADSSTVLGETYTASSSNFSDSSPASSSYSAFDGNLSTWWGAADLFTAATGIYNGAGSITTTVSGNTISGPWLQLQVTTARTLYSFSLTGRNDSNVFNSRLPAIFVVAGSTNGSTWTAIHIQLSFDFSNTQGVPTVFPCNQNNTTSYTYFRLIVQAVGCPVNATYSSHVNLAEWKLHNNSILFRSDNYNKFPIPNSSKSTLEDINNPINSLALNRTVYNRLYQAPNTGGCSYGFTQMYGFWMYQVCNIRNGTTNATMDFAADAKGNLLNYANQIDINTFLNGATGFVNIWYDQTGNNVHATQGNTSLQPQLGIDSAGNYYADSLNSSNIFMSNSGALPSGSSAYTIYIKHGSVNNTATGGLYGGGSFVTSNSNNIRCDTNGYINFWYFNDMAFGGTTPIAGNTVCASYDGTGFRYGFVNDVQVAKVTTSGMNTTAGTNTLFSNWTGSSPTNYLNGQIYYIHISRNFIGDIAGTNLTSTPNTSILTSLHNTLNKKTSELIINQKYPLDTVSTSTKSACRGAYSMIRLSINYTGPTVQIRRISDNATVNFYADISGNLGQGLNATGTSYRAWLGLSLGCVVTWYDQSGSGNHATQGTNANQPIIQPVRAFDTSFSESMYCVDSQSSGNKFLTIPSGTVPIGLNPPYTFLLRHGKVNNTAAGAFIGSGSYNSVTASNTLGTGNVFQGSSAYNNYWWGMDTGYGMISQYATGNQICSKYNGTSVSHYINNNLQVNNFNGVVGNHTTSAGTQYLFNDAGNNYLNGQIYYTYIFGTDVPDQDRLKLSTV